MGTFSETDVFGPQAAPQAQSIAVSPLPNVPGYVSDPSFTPAPGTGPTEPFGQAPAVRLGGQQELSDADVFAPNGAGHGAPAPSLRPDFMLGLYQGAVKPLDNAARGLEWLAGKAGLPVDQIDTSVGLPSAQQATDAHQAFVDRQAANGIRPGPGGKFAGEILGTLPAVAGLGPLAGGALTGALLSNAKDAKGLAFDAGFGAAGGKVADMGVNAAKSMLAPQVSDAVRTLLDSKVGLTPGQILGGASKRIEDAATSIPIFGDIIKNAQARGVSDFNRAAINRSLEPIGQTLPGNLPAGYDAVDFAHKALGEAYDQALPGLTVKIDPTFQQNTASLKALAQNLTPDYAKKFNGLLDNEVLGRFGPQTQIMTGDAMKQAESVLGQQATRFGKVQDGHAQDYADAVRQLQAELRGLVERSNPQAAQTLAAINQGWANLVRVENAASRQGATGGIFTPSQLQGAVRAGDSSVRKNATARGGALMQDLAQAGKEVLPSSVPDSGSPFRHALEATVALLVGQEAHAMPLMLKGAAIGGTLGAAYTRGGQKIVTPLLTQRPAMAKTAAELLPYLKTPAVPAGSAAMIAGRDSWPQ